MEYQDAIGSQARKIIENLGRNYSTIINEVPSLAGSFHSFIKTRKFKGNGLVIKLIESGCMDCNDKSQYLSIAKRKFFLRYENVYSEEDGNMAYIEPGEWQSRLNELASRL